MTLSPCNTEALAIVAGLALTVTPALADNCDAFRAVMAKLVNTPYRAIETMTGVVPMQTERIFTGSASYFNSGDGWRRYVGGKSPREVFRTNFIDAKLTCRRLPDEPMGREITEVFAVRREAENHLNEINVWVLKTSSLPLKLEVKYHSQTDGTIREVSTTTFSYTDVIPPSGAQPFVVHNNSPN